MELRACFEYMASQWTDDTLLVTSAGHSSGTWWDVTSDTDRVFYLTASMSLSSMFASGIAVGFPDRPVLASAATALRRDGIRECCPGSTGSTIFRTEALPGYPIDAMASTEEVTFRTRDADYAAIARGAGIERVYRFDNLDSPQPAVWRGRA